MSVDFHDTIVACASPSGSAERGIIRISGDTVVSVIDKVFTDGADNGVWKRSRAASCFTGYLTVPDISVPLPASLMLWPTSRSYTGQPMAELHTLGAPPLISAVIERLTDCGGRMANRGEFTMRAFLAGRIDLVQAEAVLGVIDASDHDELETALKQLGGGITSRLATVRALLLSLLGDLEAGLDFVEEDIEFISSEQIVQRLLECRRVVQELTETSHNRLPSGYRPRVVLAGLPNAGKSTLFNRLAGSEKAIVSSAAGTTRDYLTATVHFGRVEAELVDTAGWESAASLVMQHAQALRSDQIQQGDIVIWCTAADLPEDEEDTDRNLEMQVRSSSVTVLKVITRSDLTNTVAGSDSVIQTSAKTGDGISHLVSAVEQKLSLTSSARSELVSTTAARCRDMLRQISSSLESAISATQSQAGDEIVALELRECLHRVGVILGEVYTDDILDHIFSNFCIGK